MLSSIEPPFATALFSYPRAKNRFPSCPLAGAPQGRSRASSCLARREAEVAERCTFTTRTPVRSCKLVDQNDRNGFVFTSIRLAGREKCLMSIGTGSVTCSF